MFKKKKNLLKIVLIIFSLEKITLSSLEDIKNLTIYGNQLKNNFENLEKKETLKVLSGFLSTYIFKSAAFPIKNIENNILYRNAIKFLPGYFLPNLMLKFYESEYFKKNNIKLLLSLIVLFSTGYTFPNLKFKDSAEKLLMRTFSTYWKDENLVNIKYKELMNYFTEERKIDETKYNLIENKKSNIFYRIYSYLFGRDEDLENPRDKNKKSYNIQNQNQNQNQNEINNKNNQNNIINLYSIINNDNDEENNNNIINQNENTNQQKINNSTDNEKSQLALNLLYSFAKAINDYTNKDNNNKNFIKKFKEKINNSINTNESYFIILDELNLLLFLSKDEFNKLKQENKITIDNYNIEINSNKNQVYNKDKKTINIKNINNKVTNDLYSLYSFKDLKNINLNKFSKYFNNNVILSTFLKDIFDISFIKTSFNHDDKTKSGTYNYLHIFIQIVKEVINKINLIYNNNNDPLREYLDDLLNIQISKLNNLKKNLNKFDLKSKKEEFLDTIANTKNFFNIHLVKHLGLIVGSFLLTKIMNNKLFKKKPKN